MRKALLIYNPASGNGLFKNHLDEVVANLQNGGEFCVVSTVRIIKGIDLDNDFMINQYRSNDLIVIAGGDGTVGSICDILIKYNINVPIGIVPAGTANDFAKYLKMPKNPADAALTIATGSPINCDIGCVNGSHFINVVACGSFANTSEETNANIKPKLGVFAYYLKAIEKLHTYEPIPIRVTYDDNVIEVSALLVLFLNSANVGGFANFSPRSSINDGSLDLIIFKNKGKIINSAKTFVDVLRGNHLENEDVISVQASNFKIETINDKKIYLDVDGDKGDLLPANISNIHNAIRVIVPSYKNTEEN